MEAKATKAILDSMTDINPTMAHEFLTVQEPIRGPENKMRHVFKAIFMFTAQKSSLNFSHRLVVAAVFLTVTACAGSVAAYSPAARSAHD